MQKTFHRLFIAGYNMRAIAKSAKTHSTAKKCCGWEEPAICNHKQIRLSAYPIIIPQYVTRHILDLEVFP